MQVPLSLVGGGGLKPPKLENKLPRLVPLSLVGGGGLKLLCKLDSLGLVGSTLTSWGWWIETWLELSLVKAFLRFHSH